MSFCKDIYNMLSKKYPDRNIYLISDEHFYHRNIINYTRGEFSSAEEMNDYIIKCHNDVVGKDDIVIFLGDFSFKLGNINEILAKLNGHKYLIMGNHDQEQIIKNGSLLGFEGVFTMPVKIENMYLSHEPLLPEVRDSLTFNIIEKEFRTIADAHNYHGHIHDKDSSTDERHTNVTCEYLDYKPLLLCKTQSVIQQNLPLFINSPAFGKSISYISQKFNVRPEFLLKDYMYTTILSYLNDYMDNYFIQGSVGLYRKYGFISDFSDVDITFLRDANKSKSKNIQTMKEMVDSTYCKLLKDIDRANLEFYKIFSSLRMFEVLFTTNNPYLVKCYMDINLIFLDSYKDSDYSLYSGQSLLEKYLIKDDRLSTGAYVFPSYQSNFVSYYGDVSNLLLQLIFEDASHDKGQLIIKKLRYILKKMPCDFDFKEFEDTFIRFFLRNIALLNTLRRNGEIENIQKMYPNFANVMQNLPIPNTIDFNSLVSSSSSFMDIYGQVTSIDASNALCKTQEIMEEYRKR